MARRLTTEEAAEYLRMSPLTLRTLRHRGGGPPYMKPARKVFYDTADLDHWIEDSKRRSTADVPTPRKTRGRPRRASVPVV
jgi:hypothetical protein